jgi:pimeloyl-ACP methyl ester carboxylesterase
MLCLSSQVLGVRPLSGGRDTRGEGASMSAAQSEPAEDRVSVAGRAVRVYRKGEGAPLVVLHHSFGNRGWEAIFEQLSQSFDVIVPDLPGYGQSERPEWARSARDMAILVGRTLDRLDVRHAHVVGLGFGGWVAAELALQDPHRVDSLTLVGAAGIRPREGEIADQVLIGHTAYVRLGFSSDESFARVMGEKPAPEVVELWDFAREMTARVTWKPWMFSLQLPHLLTEVTTPTLVVWGRDDAVVPLDCGRQYAEGIPGARLEIVDGGHSVDLEQPERLAGLVAEHARTSLASMA